MGGRRRFISPLLLCLAWLQMLTQMSNSRCSEPQVIIVLGAPGEPDFAVQFRAAADELTRALGHSPILIDGTQPALENAASDRDRLIELLTSDQGERPLWLFLLGHGTFQQNVTKFNFRGPDITPAELRDALNQWRGPQLVVIAASSSAPFLSTLSKEGRIVVSSTKSGAEVNYSRFGVCLARALLDPATDIDHDDSISLLEAFISASYRVQMFYKENARLATEQALMDDNGDGKGTPATFFRGLRALESAPGTAEIDGQAARKLILVPAPGEQSLSPHQLRERERIELEIESLRSRRMSMPENEYYNRLEELFSELSQVLQIK